MPAWPQGRPQEVENKAQYFVRMTQAREVDRKIREDNERRVRMEQIRLQGREEQLARRREELNLREANIKRREEELQAREAALRNKREGAEPSSRREKTGKHPRYTQ
jgi:uncharacterized protein YecA (UPF0149 family)